jgi:hypothetical protein
MTSPSGAAQVYCYVFYSCLSWTLFLGANDPKSKMTKVLAYCAFLHGPKLSLPATGVDGASVDVFEWDRLRLLWSQVEWPFEPSAFQQRAVEFHQTVHHLFAQTAVVPFRLLSLFDDQQYLADFVARHGPGFIADLERLKTVVQMECIIFFKAPGRPDLSSGSAYLHQKAALQHALEEFSEPLKSTLSSVCSDIRIRDVKNGKRIYCQVERGREDLFRTTAQEVSVPPLLERRVSGPWPASEFLSESVKMPEVAGQR